MTNDEDLALALHKQLNAISLRKRERRGQDPAAQQSLDRIRREKQGRQRGRRERTTSSSQDHPSSKKRRISDDDHGHSSAHRRIKREPIDSNQSHPIQEDQQDAPQITVKVEHQVKQCDSRDSGMQPVEQRHSAQGDKGNVSPRQAAAVLAAQATKQQVKPLADEEGSACVKVFYAGVRWALSLPPATVKTRQLLAKALNNAFIGEILSVGQGECLTAVFLDATGAIEELRPTKWGGSKANAIRWKTLAQTAARIYVRGPDCLHKVK